MKNEIVQEIAKLVKEHQLVTLATDYKWYATAKRSPFEGRIPQNIIRYDSVEEAELLNALKESGLKVTAFPGQSSFYYITA